jgi:hypothetical protein
VEDAAIEYEFYYEPGKTLAHPALDRLTFLLDPAGVAIHWLTDAQYERTSLAAKNVTVEKQNRRGEGPVQLKVKEWNRVRLVLVGDQVTLSVNGTEIYQRPLEPTNQRIFGLFHYADETAVRVRKVRYSGQWPKKLPEPEALLAASASETR